jgi:hypothetical protein
MSEATPPDALLHAAQVIAVAIKLGNDGWCSTVDRVEAEAPINPTSKSPSDGAFGLWDLCRLILRLLHQHSTYAIRVNISPHNLRYKCALV